MSQEVYVALLRGINVSGKNVIKMERLRALCEEQGLESVASYVQSGNLVFRAEASGPNTLADGIQRAIDDALGLQVSVWVFSREQLDAVFAGNPFLDREGVDPARLHVTFLSRVPDREALARLGAVEAGADRFEAADARLYLHCPDGYGRTRLSNARVEKLLGLEATTRNWRTVTRLNALAGER